MATNDSFATAFSEQRRFSNFRDSSLTPGEAIDVALAIIEEEEDEIQQNNSHHCDTEEAYAEVNGHDEDYHYYTTAAPERKKSNSSNFRDRPKRALFQPWLLLSGLTYFVATTLGAAAVFTDSWGQLDDVKMGIFAVCNTTSGVCTLIERLPCTENITDCLVTKNTMTAIAVFSSLGLLLLLAGLLCVLLGVVAWFLVYIGAMAAFVAALLYLLAALMFAGSDHAGLEVLGGQSPSENYSFALCVLCAAIACASGTFMLQALHWQHKKLRIWGFAIRG